MSRQSPEPLPDNPEQQALLDALAAVLLPLARLAVARGVPFAALEDTAKQAFVRAAHASHTDLPAHRRVSRISTTTGLSRREVARIVQAPGREVSRQSVASQVFARWMTDPRWRDRQSGLPMALPRLGPLPSFESLAQAVTRDVHPRSMLGELVRLGLVSVDEVTDTITLVRDAFVPRDDVVRMARLLGDNVGDHLAGAVANVLGDGQQHLEQAIFADGLSQDSLTAFRALAKAQWQSLRQAMIPALQQLVDADESSGRVRDARVRIGLYTFDERQVTRHDEPADQAVQSAKTGRPQKAGATRRPTPSPQSTDQPPSTGRRRARPTSG